MTPKAQQIRDYLSEWADRYEETPPGSSPARIANRAEFARLLRVAAAAVEQDGQTQKLEAAE